MIIIVQQKKFWNLFSRYAWLGFVYNFLFEFGVIDLAFLKSTVMVFENNINTIYWRIISIFNVC